jgi:peptidoglycan/xylan/chitin deacetylase (PgdA/CDA1 family)
MTSLSMRMRDAAKRTLGGAFSLLPQALRVGRNVLAVFAFHDVSDTPSPFSEEYGLAVSPGTFRRQVSWIREAFDIIHPDDLLGDAPLPARAALITFDDGFAGSFENGLPILKALGVPCVFFLNMRAILERKAILSARACFLAQCVPEFLDFSKTVGLSPPFHVTLTPSMLHSFESSHGPIDEEAVLEYQGKFADPDTIKAWSERELVVYGNHLYDHWNSSSLSREEFEEQHGKNERALSGLANPVNLFSFPNGRPGICFSGREVAFLRSLGTGRVFSAAQIVNADPGEFLLGRISLSERDWSRSHFWFRVGQGVVNDLAGRRR